MASNQKTIFVYDDFSSGSPILMGTLYVNRRKYTRGYQMLPGPADLETQEYSRAAHAKVC